MKRVSIYFSLIIAVFIIVTMIAGGHENVGNPTVREILKGNPEADLIKLDELVYMPFNSVEHVDYSKGNLIGETNRSWWHGNLYATKLPKATKVYTTDHNAYKKGDVPFVIVVELNHEMVVYHSLREG